jgi:UDP-N-acetylmuramoylalanine--D-glutamate ligase
MSTNAHKTFFSCKRELDAGLFLRGDDVISRANGVERVLIARNEIGIRGAHNLENVMATLAVGLACGAAPDSMRKTIHEFKGVEHRLEFVAEINGVQFYNDSKATNVDSTIKALEAFDKGVLVILGGKDKGGDYAPLAPLIQSRCAHVILMGAAADKIAAALENTRPLHRATTLPDAVALGAQLAREGEVVLLAPACASFDMFDNYEHRGRVFKAAVHALP